MSTRNNNFNKSKNVREGQAATYSQDGNPGTDKTGTTQPESNQNISTAFIPLRTSSAPPDEHYSIPRGNIFPSFLPTKTNGSIKSQNSKPDNINRVIQPSLEGENNNVIPLLHEQRPPNPPLPSPEQRLSGSPNINMNGPQAVLPPQVIRQAVVPIPLQQTQYNMGPQYPRAVAIQQAPIPQGAIYQIPNNQIQGSLSNESIYNSNQRFVQPIQVPGYYQQFSPQTHIVYMGGPQSSYPSSIQMQPHSILPTGQIYAIAPPRGIPIVQTGELQQGMSYGPGAVPMRPLQQQPQQPQPQQPIYQDQQQVYSSQMMLTNPAMMATGKDSSQGKELSTPSSELNAISDQPVMKPRKKLVIKDKDGKEVTMQEIARRPSVTSTTSSTTSANNSSNNSSTTSSTTSSISTSTSIPPPPQEPVNTTNTKLPSTQIPVTESNTKKERERAGSIDVANLEAAVQALLPPSHPAKVQPATISASYSPNTDISSSTNNATADSLQDSVVIQPKAATPPLPNSHVPSPPPAVVDIPKNENIQVPAVLGDKSIDSSEKSLPISEKEISDPIPNPNEVVINKVASNSSFGSVTTAGTDEDDWEDQAPKIEVKPVRSLRPGGSTGQTKKLNEGAKIDLKPKISYTKSELLSIKPLVSERPDILLCYSEIVLVDDRGQRIVIIPPKSTTPPPSSGSNYSGHEGNKWQNKQPNQYQQQNFHSGAVAYDTSSPQQPQVSWQRAQPGSKEYQQQQQQQQSAHSKKIKISPQKKIITDPKEKFSREVNEILNKIAPQTFDKLTNILCEMQIEDSAMLDRMIELVFEKAIYEQNFANMYADLGAALESHSRFWNFLRIIYSKDSNQYFWATDITFDKSLWGPFRTAEDCSIVLRQNNSQLNIVYMNPKLKISDFVCYEDSILKIFKHEDLEEYYVNITHLSELNKTSYPNMFPTFDKAYKDAKKKNSVRRRLVKLCQDEFSSSIIDNVGDYGKYVEAKKNFDKVEMTLSPDDKAQQMYELEELKGKLKRRKLGNIRFIGELCKKGLINISTIHECIWQLLADSYEEGDINWKSIKDDEEIEVLCKLLRTVGLALDEDPLPKHIENMTLFFNRLNELTKDKSLNSRMRFSIQEIIELRQNKWVERRQQEGPLKIEQVHQRAAQEEMMKRSGNLPIAPSLNPSKQDARLTTGNKVHFNKSGPISRIVSIGPGVTPESTSTPQISIMSRHGNNNRPRSGSGNIDTKSSFNSSSSDSASYTLNKKTTIVEEEQQTRPSNQKSVPDMPLPQLQRRIQSIIDEYLQTGDVSEVKLGLEELPKVSYRVIIMNIISKFIQGAKEPIQQSLLSLIDNLASILKDHSSGIIESLTTCEDITMLPDAMLDCKQAPTYIGMVIGRLIRTSVINSESISPSLDKIQRDNINDAAEYGSDEKTIISAYDSLRESIQKFI